MIHDVPTERQYSGSIAPARFAGPGVPIVIDNGTNTCRAGFANAKDPHLVFENTYAKYKPKGHTKAIHVVGEDILLDPLARQNVKSPYDASTVTNWDAMEGVLDYIFLNLGLEGRDHVNPIVLTETVCNLRASRKVMSEMLFETYHAPSIAYGIDSLFSFYQNDGHEGVVIGSGNLATHVIPVISGSCELQNSKRLSLGGSSIPDYMLRLAQLKYPSFPTKVTPTQANALMRNHCYVSQDYSTELSRILQQDLKEKDRTIQFPS